jgi:hypothetical protein
MISQFEQGLFYQMVREGVKEDAMYRHRCGIGCRYYNTDADECRLFFTALATEQNCYGDEKARRCQECRRFFN